MQVRQSAKKTLNYLQINISWVQVKNISDLFLNCQRREQIYLDFKKWAGKYDKKS